MTDQSGTARRAEEGGESGESERRRLLEAALIHVPFDGWSRRALLAGAASLGMEAGRVDALFPGGVPEFIRAFSREADRRMLSELESRDLESERVRDRIATAVRLRIELLAPYREAVRRGLTYFAAPQHAAAGLRLVYRTVDAIWHAAGDRSTDHNFYSKRLLLAGVYSSTLLYWVSDRSEGFEATWGFLDRRLEEVMKIGGTLGRGFGRLLDLPDRLIGMRQPEGRAARGLRGGFVRRFNRDFRTRG